MRKRTKVPKPKVFHIWEPIFTFNVHVVIGGSRESAADRFSDAFKWGSEPVKYLSANATTFYKGDERDVGIWFRRKPTPKLVVHECFHAVTHILGHVGVRLTDESEEAYAYLLGWLVEEVHAST